ncbi:MAG: hypothetical protein KG029_10925 [Bacteroidetes bacterium]|nr:hypothetical protein [Bacteroidota bacterium]
MDKPHSKERLVIFIDNLDRLTEDKIIEALESLKTYLSSDSCVFVVACDDNVVRTVINENFKKGEKDHNNGKAGEHYLDKFFQQTFRLPEYNGLDLRDCAERNFETTQLYDELYDRGVDVRNLIAIIVPSDVNSPRKVKRLLNEFIALYEIVKRRENEKDGQLKPNLLTGNLEFLGKFSTIRAEYPDFYQALVHDPALLEKITTHLLKKSDEAQSLLKDLDLYSESLMFYLRKTQTIVMSDIYPYLWLSQDTRALELKGNHHNLLLTYLPDGNIQQFKSLLDSENDKNYRTKLVNVASRIVEERLVGIEQQNGVKVLSHLLSEFEDEIKQQIAHAAARLIPLSPIDVFSTDEVFNVLRWARWRGIDTQKEEFINLILKRLDDSNLRQPTFDAILQNADIVEKNSADETIRQWLTIILSADMQSAIEIKDAENENLTDPNLVNREFAEWLISRAETYSNDDSSIKSYFSQELIDYIFHRLLGNFENVDAVYLSQDEIGKNILILLNIVATRIDNGINNQSFWRGIILLIKESPDSFEIQYCLEKTEALIDHLNTEFIEELQQNIIAGFCNLVDEEKEENSDATISIFEKAINVVTLLQRRKKQTLNKEIFIGMPANIARILQFDAYQKPLLLFVENFANEFGKDDSEIYISGIVEAFGEETSDENSGINLIDSLINLNDRLTQMHRSKIVEKINVLISSNDQAQVDLALKYMSKIVSILEYKEPIASYVDIWISKFGPDALSLLEKKFGIYNLLIESEILNVDDLVNNIIPHFPFSGDQEKLQVIFTGLMVAKKNISNVVGKDLFHVILSNVSTFGNSTIKAFELIASWIDDVEESDRIQFHSHIIQSFTTSPVEYMCILSDAWKGLTNSQIQEHLIQFYSIDMSTGDYENRNESVERALDTIDEENRPDVIQNIWDSLIAQEKSADAFMVTAVNFLPLDVLYKIRDNAIGVVSDSSASDKHEANLKLLSVTIRNDMRKIMPTVDLFENLFGRGKTDVQLALKYVVPCLKPLISDAHKKKLAAAMGKASNRIDDKEIKDEIEEKTRQLGLKWWNPNFWK